MSLRGRQPSQVLKIGKHKIWDTLRFFFLFPPVNWVLSSAGPGVGLPDETPGVEIVGAPVTDVAAFSTRFSDEGVTSIADLTRLFSGWSGEGTGDTALICFAVVCIACIRGITICSCPEFPEDDLLDFEIGSPNTEGWAPGVSVSVDAITPPSASSEVLFSLVEVMVAGSGRTGH